MPSKSQAPHNMFLLHIQLLHEHLHFLQPAKFPYQGAMRESSHQARAERRYGVRIVLINFGDKDFLAV